MIGIELDEVRFAYPNGHVALESVSIEIEVGESVAIIGQNGAGKTTVAKLMNGLLRPTSGTVRIGGEDSLGKTTATIARDVGYVFQNPDDQIFHSTVEAEIAFGPRRMGVEGEELESRVRHAAERAGVADVLGMNPYDLPFSTRKFVTIACTLATGCRALVLDEPTAGQDLRGNRVLAELLAAERARGTTLVTITHDMEFVAEHFERVIVMAQQRVVIDTDVRSAFWELDSLAQARVAQPHPSALAREMGLDGRPLSEADFEAAYLEQRSA